MALSATARAEQAEECSLSRTEYDPSTNEVTQGKARGVAMRSVDRGDICAEPEKVQYWMNQGFTVLTSGQRAREVSEQADREAGERADDRNRTEDTTLLIVVGAMLGALAYWYFVLRSK